MFCGDTPSKQYAEENFIDATYTEINLKQPSGVVSPNFSTLTDIKYSRFDTEVC